MKTFRPRKSVRSLAAALGVTALYVFAAATPAAADTSTASAQAAEVDVLSLDVVNTGTATATNSGPPQPRVDAGSSQPVGVLGGQTLLVAGLLVQRAVADPDGTSAACAGAVGPNGTIQIGQSDDCIVTTSPGGVKLLGAVPILGIATGALLSADAIYATCNASSTGPTTGSATVLNGVLGGSLLGGILTGGTPIAVNPGPNTVLNVLGIAITLNKQVTLPNGALEVTALDADLSPLGLDLGQVTIGKVTCGPNAVTPVIPVVPADGLPLAAGIVMLAMAGSAVVVIRRRRAVAG